MSRKSQDSKKVRKRVNATAKKQKKQKHKISDEPTLDKMVKKQLNVSFVDCFCCNQVALLMNKTELSEEVIRGHHTSFLKECPSGEMTRDLFVELSEVTIFLQSGFKDL